MTDLFYRCLMFVSAFTGAWFFRAMAWWVATGYFILFPQRVAISVNFYKALFPARGFFVSSLLRLAAVSQLHHGVSRPLACAQAGHHYLFG